MPTLIGTEVSFMSGTAISNQRASVATPQSPNKTHAIWSTDAGHPTASHQPALRSFIAAAHHEFSARFQRGSLVGQQPDPDARIVRRHTRDPERAGEKSLRRVASDRLVHW